MSFVFTFNRTSSAFVSFRCGNPVRFSYPLKSFILGMKALNVAKETYIRINGDGMMCVQHQVISIFVENHIQFHSHS